MIERLFLEVAELYDALFQMSTVFKVLKSRPWPMMSHVVNHHTEQLRVVLGISLALISIKPIGVFGELTNEEQG
jgi:hypothetical protein